MICRQDIPFRCPSHLSNAIYPHHTCIQNLYFLIIWMGARRLIADKGALSWQAFLHENVHIKVYLWDDLFKAQVCASCFFIWRTFMTLFSSFSLVTCCDIDPTDEDGRVECFSQSFLLSWCCAHLFCSSISGDNRMIKETPLDPREALMWAWCQICAILLAPSNLMPIEVGRFLSEGFHFRTAVSSG